jgi:hypothetical protein
MFAIGLTGYAAGMAISIAVQIVQRGYYLRRLFPGYRPIAHLMRAVLPSVPPSGVILLERLLVGGGRSPARAVAELVAYVVLTIACTWFFERRLLGEMVGYLRGGGGGLRTKAQALPRTAPRAPSRA